MKYSSLKEVSLVTLMAHIVQHSVEKNYFTAQAIGQVAKSVSVCVLNCSGQQPVSGSGGGVTFSIILGGS